MARRLYFATRDWIDDTDDDLQAEIRALLYELLDASRTLFSSPVSDMTIHERRVDAAFSDSVALREEASDPWTAVG